jgi:hypothetical protein
MSYAKQTEQDYEAFAKASRAGRIKTVTEASERTGHPRRQRGGERKSEVGEAA